MSDVLAGEVATLSEVAAWAAYLPTDSATARAVNPHWMRSDTLEFLRRIDYGVRVLSWQNAHGKGPVPEMVKFPWDPKPEGSWIGDALDWDEAVDLLGGDDRLRAVMARM